MHKIWFNGKGYPDPEAMPPEIRIQYERALSRKDDAGWAEGSEVVRMGVWEEDGDGTLEVHTSQEIVVNGKKYSDISDLPPREREMVRRMMEGVPDFEAVFEDDGLMRTFNSRASSTEGVGGDSPGSDLVGRRTASTRPPETAEARRGGSPWASGWAVALILALALLWVLVFGGEGVVQDHQPEEFGS